MLWLMGRRALSRCACYATASISPSNSHIRKEGLVGVMSMVRGGVEAPRPSAGQYPIVGPPRSVADLLDPLKRLTVEQPVVAPPLSRHSVKIYAHRMLRIRRKKIKKHWRMKRYRKRRVVYLRLHAEKKQKAENLFRARINAMLHEGLNFDAEQYVRGVLERAKWQPAEQRLPDGRRKYPHWTTLMTIEELYEVPDGDYIDKSHCTASDEDWEEIQKLKQKYYDTFGKLTK